MPRFKWRLQEARNSFSEVVRKAQSDGPQMITLRGRDAAVVVSAKDYARFSRPKGRLVEFFRNSPLVGVELNLTRSRAGRPSQSVGHITPWIVDLPKLEGRE